MVDHVLIPVDGSDQATAALEFAFETYPDAHFSAINVLDPADFYAATGIEGGGMGGTEQLRKSQEDRGKQVLEQANATAAEANVDLETEQLIGGVSRSIVSFAEENDVDHIVIGSHGRTGATRILLGSVAETVARRSPVPVTIVR
ncbi:MAG: universal stress protein [Natrialbaceae archaeon]|nr:universal stress protein [Natrialbaceae archaeon]